MLTILLASVPPARVRIRCNLIVRGVFVAVPSATHALVLQERKSFGKSYIIVNNHLHTKVTSSAVRILKHMCITSGVHQC